MARLLRSATVAGTLALSAGPALAITAQPLGPGITPEDLVGSLLGPGGTVGTVSYTGDNRAAGGFVSGLSSVGFDSGIILSSGQVVQIAGPDSSDSTSTSLGVPGDVDLNALISGTTNDAAVLEFDFVPSGPEVTFR